MPDKENVNNSDSILVSEGSNLPESISKWVLKESGDVFECSPFLGHISRFFSSHNEFSKITVGVLSEGSEKYKQQNN